MWWNMIGGNRRRRRGKRERVNLHTILANTIVDNPSRGRCGFFVGGRFLCCVGRVGQNVISSCCASFDKWSGVSGRREVVLLKASGRSNGLPMKQRDSVVVQFGERIAVGDRKKTDQIGATVTMRRRVAIRVRSSNLSSRMTSISFLISSSVKTLSRDFSLPPTTLRVIFTLGSFGIHPFR